jgi:hypothetical protein
MCAFQVHIPQWSPQAHDAETDRVVYVFGCTHEGCGKMEGSWRAFSHQLHARSAKSSAIQPPLDTAAKEGPSNAETNGTRQLEWDAVDPPERDWQNITTGLPAPAKSSDDWGFDASQIGKHSTATADKGTSQSLEELSAALEGLTTSSSKGAQVFERPSDAQVDYMQTLYFNCAFTDPQYQPLSTVAFPEASITALV